MTTLLDANVLIALALPDHVHHRSAEAWFAAFEGDFATCPMTQGALVRMLMRENTAAAHALDVLRVTVEHSRHDFWPDDLAFVDVRVHGVLGHRQVTDAYLAALARSRGGRLATFDRGCAAVHADVADLVPVRS